MPSAEGHQPSPPTPVQAAAAAAEEEDEDEQLQRREESVGKASEGHADDAEEAEGKNGDEYCKENLANLRYLIPYEAKATFAFPDLVWGKVTGFPWWPGQILDPSYASRKAKRLRKDGRFLVAYFGDKTFAWCSPSQLRPFVPSYREMESQSPSHVFSCSVREVLAEAARRVETGMLCSCVPEELCSNVKYQYTENAGIQKGIAIPTLDTTLGPSAFNSEEFLEYVRALAVCPKGELGRLDLVLAQAHLMSYRRSEGYANLCTFTEGMGLVENDSIAGGSKGFAETLNSIPKHREELSEGLVGSFNMIPKDEEKLSDFISRKLGPKTLTSSCRKRKNVAEVQRDYSRLSKTTRSKNGSFENASDEGSGKKRKKTTISPYDIGESKKKMPELLGDVVKKSPSPVSYQSFKVGEFIRRFASRLTNSSPIIRTNDGTLQERKVEDEFSGGRISEGNESANTPSSSVEVRTMDKNKSMNGKICYADEEAEQPKDIKYSRRPKRRHDPDEIQTPPKEIKYLERPKHGRGSDEDQTASKEIKYSRRIKSRQSSQEGLTPPPKEITYSRRPRSMQSSDEDSSTS